MTQTDTQTITNAGSAVVDLLKQHWDQIKEWGEADEKGLASVGMTLKLSFVGKVPKGVVNLSFATRVKDAVEFSGEQMKLKGVE